MMKFPKVLVGAFCALAITACGSDSDSDDFDDEAALIEFAEKYLGIWVGECETYEGGSNKTQFEITDEPGELLDAGVDYSDGDCESSDGGWGITPSSYEVTGVIDDGETSGFKVKLDLPEDYDDEGGKYKVLVSKIYEDEEGEHFLLTMGFDDYPEDFDDGEQIEFTKTTEPLVVELEIIEVE